MSTRNLEELMAPRSVVAIGASTRPGSVGAAVTRNLLAGGFQGDIHLVNIKGGTIEGRPVLKSLAELHGAGRPRGDHDAAARRCRGSSWSSASAARGRPSSSPRGRATADGAQDNARWRKRILRAGAAASAAHRRAELHRLRRAAARPQCELRPERARAGRLAAVAQSGAVLAGLADWGAAQDIGFSHLISMGDMADVDFGDVLDMLARDFETRAILMYVEGITHARKFMSAARGVARVKPVIVLKAGRHAAAAKAAASHTGSMAGSAAVYDAAFARAGLVRVNGLGELFDAAETLGYGIAPRNERLAILTNGGGAGIIATDLLMDEGGELAALQPRTDRPARQASAARLVARQSGRHRAATPTARATRRRSTPWPDDRGVGAVLAMNVPTALASSVEVARARWAARGRQGGAGDRLLDRRAARRRGRAQGAARGRHPGLRHAAARRARLHAHRAVSPRPARTAAHAALGARGALGHAAGARHRARRARRGTRDPDRARGQARARGLRHSRRADRGRARCRRGGGGGASRIGFPGRREDPVARDHATRATWAA